MKVESIKISPKYIVKNGLSIKRRGKITISSPDKINLNIEQEAQLLKFLEQL